MMSKIGRFDVLTASGAFFIPNIGQIKNSPTGVCSMFILKFLICSTENKIGTLPLSRMSALVVIHPVVDVLFLRWIMSRSRTVDSSPLAKAKRLKHDSVENHMLWLSLCCLHACTSRSIAYLEPIALVHPESKITYVGCVFRSMYSVKSVRLMSWWKLRYAWSEGSELLSPTDAGQSSWFSGNTTEWRIRAANAMQTKMLTNELMQCCPKTRNWSFVDTKLQKLFFSFVVRWSGCPSSTLSTKYDQLPCQSYESS